MADYRAFAIKLLTSDGKVSAKHIKLLKKFLSADDKVPEEDLAFLGSVRDALLAHRGKVNPRFEAFYLKCIESKALADGSVGPGEIEWLRKHLLADATIRHTSKRKFLNELKKKAGATVPEFDGLFDGLAKKKAKRKATSTADTSGTQS